MSTTYRSAVRKFLPQAKIVADRFHVHRMFTRVVNRVRKEITGDDRKNPIRKLVLRNQSRLRPEERRALWIFLNHYPRLREAYQYKEAVNRLYRIKGYRRARIAFKNLCDRMANSKIPRIAGIRKTMLDWRNEILQFFITPMTNGRVEGFNRKAKLLQRKAYGYSKIENYRLRLLGETAVRHSRR